MCEGDDEGDDDDDDDDDEEGKGYDDKYECMMMKTMMNWGRYGTLPARRSRIISLQKAAYGELGPACSSVFGTNNRIVAMNLDPPLSHTSLMNSSTLPNCTRPLIVIRGGSSPCTRLSDTTPVHDIPMGLSRCITAKSIIPAVLRRRIGMEERGDTWWRALVSSSSESSSSSS